MICVATFYVFTDFFKDARGATAWLIVHRSTVQTQAQGGQGDESHARVQDSGEPEEGQGGKTAEEEEEEEEDVAEIKRGRGENHRRRISSSDDDEEEEQGGRGQNQNDDDFEDTELDNFLAELSDSDLACEGEG